ncbi:MAG: restriction endonuclease subunit S, partial [Candidatus Desulfofervidus auxilii]|nr:restriction endonuclease subunit S [Candidatus Desulfofervidus auxilii]
MKIVKIKDIGKVVTGKTPSTKRPEFFGDKYPFITPSDIPSYDVYHIYKTERGLSEEGYLNQKSKLLPPRTVCYVCIGSTVGKICLTKVPSFTNQQLNNIIVDKERFVPEYIYYRLRYETPRIQSIAGGTG